ncbi:adenylate/guanylate cyclase domain-containing protein [Kaistia granuli]|uniref:adenylate/guanylate cyclase domain-containing protein n=1 Tax=Kaistia granuli TaxID=363259 RepID=UPI000367CF13|nr:tetratricopeptide repeat protein [Kaistia granuli]
MARPRRRLTVIAALDVVGYSELIQRDEMGAIREMRSIYRTLVRPTFGRYGAHIIKTMGDGGLIEFPSVLDAVEWTMAFQNAMAARNAARDRPPVEVRAAIVLADIILTEDDRFGAAIGFAMRLQTAAPPGGIAITHSVRWQLLGEPAAAFRPAGFLTLRSIPYPVEAWFWMPEGKALPNLTPTPSQMLTPGSLGVPPLQRVQAPDLRPLAVVLPFDDLSPANDHEAFADGVVEEMTATLSRVRDIRVIARNSAFTYKNRPTDVRSLARDLGVRYVVEGSVRKAGDVLRVTAQLVDAETGAHLWSGRKDGTVHDTLTLQDDVATLVAGALRPAVRSAEIERARRKAADTLKTHDLVLKAMPHFWAHRREDNIAALELLEQALASDPNSGAALSLKAWCLSQQITYLWSDDPERDRMAAIELAERAAETAEPDPLVMTAIGATYSILLADQARALVYIERAIALDTTFAWAWTRLGYAQAYSGRPAEGLESFEKSIALSPEDPIQFNAFAGIATCQFLLGRYAEAAHWAAQALHGRPGMVWAYRLLATSAALAGQTTLARSAVRRLLAETPGLTVAGIGAAVQNLEGPPLEKYLEGLRLAGLPEG